MDDGSVSVVAANDLAQRVSAMLRTAAVEELGAALGCVVWLALPCYTRMTESWLPIWRLDAGVIQRVTAWFRTVGSHTPG